ncbi:MAG: IS200/IS605 family transposase [Candidatus Aenigmatarchaeota archaeon]
MTEFVSASHAVGEANYHIQLTPAYRRDIFADECVRVLTRDYLLAAASRHKIVVASIGFGEEHVHIFAVGCKNHSPSQVAFLLKGFSSRMMRKNHRVLFKDKLYGKKFWSSGYFYRTVGAVSTETVKKYVEESQQKHWSKPEAPNTQKTLIEFDERSAL